MRTRKLTYSDRKPWTPIRNRMVPHKAGLYTCGRELHVDARYLAYAEARFTGCTFWCIAATAVAVRNQRALEVVGVVAGRQPPRRRRKVAT